VAENANMNLNDQQQAFAFAFPWLETKRVERRAFCGFLQGAHRVRSCSGATIKYQCFYPFKGRIPLIAPGGGRSFW
jgi:hypothetical protein